MPQHRGKTFNEVFGDTSGSAELLACHGFIPDTQYRNCNSQLLSVCTELKCRKRVRSVGISLLYIRNFSDSCENVAKEISIGLQRGNRQAGHVKSQEGKF